MKKLNLLALLLFFLIPLLITSCGGNDPSDPGSGLSGALSGNIILNDEYGRPLEDNSGVTVLMDGTSYSVTSNTAGTWEFDALPNGTYIMKFTKDGFAESQLNNFQFVVPGHYYMRTTGLFRHPTFTVSNLKIRETDTTVSQIRTTIHDSVSGTSRDTVITHISVGTKYIIMEGDIDQVVPAGAMGKVAVVLGSEPSVSKEAGKYTSVVDVSVPENSSHFYHIITAHQFSQEYPFVPGAQVYATAYPAAYYRTTYLDPVTEKEQLSYIAPRPTSVVNFLFQ